MRAAYRLALATLLSSATSLQPSYQKIARQQRRGVMTLRQARKGRAAFSPLRSADAARYPELLAPGDTPLSAAARGSAPSAGAAQAGEQTLFRHRFLVNQDFCIRMPLDAQSLLYSCTMNADLSGYMELQLEAFRPLAKVRWSPDARRMLSLPNAGGSSLVSEALALELLARTFGASLKKTETELVYHPGSKMTDFAIDVFGGYPLGVSVTRAYKWRGDFRKVTARHKRAAKRQLQQQEQRRRREQPPRPRPPRHQQHTRGAHHHGEARAATEAMAAVEAAAEATAVPCEAADEGIADEDDEGEEGAVDMPMARFVPAGLQPCEARRLLIKKLAAIKESSRNVQNHSWRKQLLVVFTFSHGDAALLERQYELLPAGLRSNTVLVVTRTNGVQWIW